MNNGKKFPGIFRTLKKSKTKEQRQKLKNESCHKGFWKQYKSMMFEEIDNDENKTDLNVIKVGHFKLQLSK